MSLTLKRVLHNSFQSSDCVSIISMTIREQIELIESRRTDPTIKQVFADGMQLVKAYGLNEWCMNEGLATGDEIMSTHERLNELKASQKREDEQKISPQKAVEKLAYYARHDHKSLTFNEAKELSEIILSALN